MSKFTDWQRESINVLSKTTSLNKHMVIGDVHADPLISNRRALWLGRMAAFYQPEYIIQIGDLFDFASLSRFDIGSVAAEYRRVDHDIAAGQQWCEMFNKPIEEHNANKKYKIYNPKKIIVLGNHDNRLDLHGQADPKSSGIYNTANLGLERWGWEVVPFLESKTIDRITYKHFETRPNTGRAMGGIHHANALLNATHGSITVGHSHILDYKRQVIRRSGRTINALVTGCALDPDQSPAYAKEDPRNWWRGAVIKSNVSDGNYDLNAVSMDTIQKLFGRPEDNIPPIVELPEVPTTDTSIEFTPKGTRL